jgi:protein ImuA
MLDLVASRRLSLAAGESGVSMILLREQATAEPSAALTRWDVASAPSPRDHDDDWGNPVFDTRLTRHRMGGLGAFHMQWNCHHAAFQQTHPGAVAAAPAHRPTYTEKRRAV